MTSVEVHDAAARQGLAEAKRAVWAEDDWDAGVAHCQEMIWFGDRLPDGATVVDIGCGMGRLLIPYAREFPKVRFVGIDPSDAMRQHVRDACADLVNVVVAPDWEDIPWTCDVAFAEPGPLSHPRTRREMDALLLEAGFTVANFEADPVYPSWTWCTARTEPT